VSAPEEVPDDCTLVARMALRDSSAITLLYDRYAALAVGLSFHLLRDPVAAEWVVEKAFLAL